MNILEELKYRPVPKSKPEFVFRIHDNTNTDKDTEKIETKAKETEQKPQILFKDVQKERNINRKDILANFKRRVIPEQPAKQPAEKEQEAEKELHAEKEQEAEK